MKNSSAAPVHIDGSAQETTFKEVYELRLDNTRNWAKKNPDWKGFDTTGLGLTGKNLEEAAMMLMDKDPHRRPSLEQVLSFPCFDRNGIYSNEQLAGLVKTLKEKEKEKET